MAWDFIAATANKTCSYTTQIGRAFRGSFVISRAISWQRRTQYSWTVW